MKARLILTERPPEGLPMMVIYDHPSDYPDAFVVREMTVTAGGQVLASLISHQFDSFEDARESVRQGRICIRRHPKDDPVIVECWV